MKLSTIFSNGSKLKQLIKFPKKIAKSYYEANQLAKWQKSGS